MRQRSASASVSTSASMYRIPPCSSSLGFAAFVVTLGYCFALLLFFSFSFWFSFAVEMALCLRSLIFFCL